MIFLNVMKKTFNILIFSFLTLAIGFWGEIVELSNDEVLSTATEMCEKVEKEDKAESISHVETFEKVLKSGQGGGKNNLEKTFKLPNAPVEGPLSIFNVFFQNHQSNSLSVEAYNTQVSNTLYIPKFYILYHCTKSFLS
jgi:hypothetical protein